MRFVKKIHCTFRMCKISQTCVVRAKEEKSVNMLLPET